MRCEYAIFVVVEFILVVAFWFPVMFDWYKLFYKNKLCCTDLPLACHCARLAAAQRYNIRTFTNMAHLSVDQYRSVTENSCVQRAITSELKQKKKCCKV